MTKEQKKLLALLPGYRIRMSNGILYLMKDNKVIEKTCARISMKLRELAGTHDYVDKYNRYYRV